MTRGGAFYDNAEVQARYTEHREPDRFNPNHVMEEPAVLAEVGDPAGLRVIDLGCGDGSFGWWLLANGGASYFGVDGSQAMITLAERTLTGTSGRVMLGDLEDFDGPPASAELITARLSLHYLADLTAVCAAAARALTPGGRFVLTVVHPVITSHDNRPSGPRTSWTVDDYFLPGPRPRDWLGARVTWYHRTVEQYVRALTEAGFTLSGLRECAPEPDRLDGDLAELARRRRVPLFLLVSGRCPG